jgi:hypothetical protein
MYEVWSLHSSGPFVLCIGWELSEGEEQMMNCYISRLLNSSLIIWCILLYVVFYEVGDTVLKIGYEHFDIMSRWVGPRPERR